MVFEIKKRVCYCHTDAGGVVYHSRYLDFYEEARIEFFIAKGYDQKRLMDEFGILFVLRNCEIEFKNPARLEDMLTITIEKMDIKNPSIFLEQNIYCKNTLYVSCKIKMVAVDKNFKLIRKLPKTIEEICVITS